MTPSSKTAPLVKQGQAESAPVATAPAAPTFERIRKITTKTFGKLEMGVENGVRVSGAIRGTKLRTGTYGDYIAFVGDFRAIVGGMIYSASELILPAFPEGILREGFEAAFNAVPKGVDAKIEATFGMVIYKKDDSANTKNARGFTWEVKQLHAIKLPDVQNDHLLKLLA